ncbi:C4 protein [Persimmon circular DNA virus]|nr:C4 protein [Persimmon circular DNA virus]
MPPTNHQPPVPDQTRIHTGLPGGAPGRHPSPALPHPVRGQVPDEEPEVLRPHLSKQVGTLSSQRAADQVMLCGPVLHSQGWQLH